MLKKILCITQPTLSKYVKIGKINVINYFVLFMYFNKVKYKRNK